MQAPHGRPRLFAAAGSGSSSRRSRCFSTSCCRRSPFADLPDLPDGPDMPGWLRWLRIAFVIAVIALIVVGEIQKDRDEPRGE